MQSIHRRTQGGPCGCLAPYFGFAPTFYFRTQAQGAKKLYLTSLHPNDTPPFPETRPGRIYIYIYTLPRQDIVLMYDMNVCIRRP